jgi:RNA polymerase sigma factor (sigma-70 family)
MANIKTLDSRAQAGNESAMRESLSAAERVAALYQAHREEVYRFVVGQGLDPATAQDVAQEVFVRLFAALNKGTRLVSEQAWLYSVAAKLVVDYWRREGRSMWVELDSLAAPDESVQSKEPTPEVHALRKERLQRVAAAMARLPKEQRLGIHLRMQGLRYRAIAKILGVSVSTAAEWLSIAVERLRGVANE